MKNGQDKKKVMKSHKMQTTSWQTLDTCKTNKLAFSVNTIETPVKFGKKQTPPVKKIKQITFVKKKKILLNLKRFSNSEAEPLALIFLGLIKRHLEFLKWFMNKRYHAI
jgi:hypothetical protein